MHEEKHCQYDTTRTGILIEFKTRNDLFTVQFSVKFYSFGILDVVFKINKPDF